MIYKFKTKYNTRRKFMVIWYWGYVNVKNDGKPVVDYIIDGEFNTDCWDEDVVHKIGELDIGQKYDDYGPGQVSHMSVYRYA